MPILNPRVSLVPQEAKIGSIHTNTVTRGRTKGRRDQLGRQLARDNSRKGKVDLQTIPPEGSSNSERGLHSPLSDPAKLDKVSNCHKLLCQLPQEPLPAGDKNTVELVDNQRSRGGFQQAFSSTQTQQVETYTRSEQTKSFPQGGKMQDGDTGNYLDVPPARGVGYLNRLQGCLLPYTNTGTVQEIFMSTPLGGGHIIFAFSGVRPLVFRSFEGKVFILSLPNFVWVFIGLIACMGLLLVKIGL